MTGVQTCALPISDLIEGTLVTIPPEMTPESVGMENNSNPEDGNEEMNTEENSEMDTEESNESNTDNSETDNAETDSVE